MEIRRRSAIGEGERAFFRDLVEENGLYKKDPEVTIEKENISYADYSVRGRKSGTVADVSLKIREAPRQKEEESKKQKEERKTPSFEIEGEGSTYRVEVIPIRDTGVLEEVVDECIRYMAERMYVRDKEEIFTGRRIAREDIYRRREGIREIRSKSCVYGVVGSSFFTSPVNQEADASDSLVFITSEQDIIKTIQIRGGVEPEMLRKILERHVQPKGR